jgi:ornithine cyclodeaminase/alanine dehydrogenase-like protein (mu-crystallin family)
MGTLIVTEAELRACLPLDKGALAAVEQAFTWIEEGCVSMPPVMHIDVDADSAVDTKGAFVEGLDHLAVKIATGFFRNPQKGLPSCSSTIALMDAKTGLFDCVFLDNGYLMDLRTGLAGAVAAKHLAPQDVDTVGVIGTGVQARYQIESLALVRSFKRVVVYGRHPGRVSDYCLDMAERLKIPVEPLESIEELVKAAQIVVTTTQATEPLVSAEWVHPGLHITAMGSDLPGKQELESEILRRADLVVCDTLAQCKIGGEIQHMARANIDRDVIELGAFTSGARQFERTQQSVTICDLTGTGAQDTAIAAEALARIKREGLGTLVG